MQDASASVADGDVKMIDLSYSDTRSAKDKFRCANSRYQGSNGRDYVNIDCIDSDRGWRFNYVGAGEHASEALSVLQQAN